MAHWNSTPDHVLLKIEELMQAGATRSELVAEAGVSRDTILRLHKAGRLSRLPDHAKRESPSKVGKGLRTPPWIVDPVLKSEYRDYAGVWGQPQAARLVAGMMRDAARPEV